MTQPIKTPTAAGSRGEAGFTLVEALCAIVILAFGLMAVANLMVVAATSNSVANQGTAATTLATQQMERLKNIPFTDENTNVLNANLQPGGDLETDQPGYFIDPANPVPGEPQIDVQGVGRMRVRWQISAVDARTLFIVVRSEGTGALSGARSRAEFTVFRTCTDQAPPPGLNCP